jgi:hypothetical protein
MIIIIITVFLVPCCTSFQLLLQFLEECTTTIGGRTSWKLIKVRSKTIEAKLLKRDAEHLSTLRSDHHQ